MLNAALFERAIAWAAAEPQAHELTEARAEFERRTGPIVNSATDYEARIAHFFEQALCAQLAAGRPPLISRFAAHASPSEPEREELAGWLRSHRSLWKFEGVREGQGKVHDLIGGARFRFELVGVDRELREGDIFDGRLVAVTGALSLSPGRVFHPQAAEVPLQAMLQEARGRGTLDASLLDPLLGMRSRLLGFESIRAEHVYRLDALDAQGMAAPWARPAQRNAVTRDQH